MKNRNHNSNRSSSLREVGVPSRNTLHGKGVWSKRRIGVRGLGGSSGALEIYKKDIKAHNRMRFVSLKDVLILAPGRVRVCVLLQGFTFLMCSQLIMSFVSRFQRICESI